MDWFLYGNGLRHERVNLVLYYIDKRIHVFLYNFLSLKYHFDFPAFRYWESILVWCGVENIYCYRQVIFEIGITKLLPFSCVILYQFLWMFLKCKQHFYRFLVKYFLLFSLVIYIILAYIKPLVLNKFAEIGILFAWTDVLSGNFEQFFFSGVFLLEVVVLLYKVFVRFPDILNFWLDFFQKTFQKRLS